MKAGDQVASTKIVYVGPGIVAELMGVTRTTVRAWALRGQLPWSAFVELPSGHIRYDLNHFLARLDRERRELDVAARRASRLGLMSVLNWLDANARAVEEEVWTPLDAIYERYVGDQARMGREAIRKNHFAHAVGIWFTTQTGQVLGRFRRRRQGSLTRFYGGVVLNLAEMGREATA